MNEHRKPEGCMCMGNCATCKRNATSTEDKKAEGSPKPYFGESPDDLEARTSKFVDKHFR